MVLGLVAAEHGSSFFSEDSPPHQLMLTCLFDNSYFPVYSADGYWAPDVKSWLIGKDPDAGKDQGQEKKGMTDDEMVGCHHWLNDMNVSKLQEMWRTEKPGMLRSMR